MSKNIQQIFVSVGLNEKEINVYLTGLRLGPILASDVARECDLTRSNAYDVLKILLSRGFCTRLSNAYGGKFKMSDPAELLHSLERQKQEQEDIIAEFQKIIPLLNETKGSHYHTYPLIEYFEGEGVKKILIESLMCQKKEICMVTAVNKFADIFGKTFARSYVRKRSEAGIVSKTIREYGADFEDEFVSSNKKYNREVRYAPKGVRFDSTIMLFDNRIGIITKEGSMFLGTLITSTPIANTFRNWFEVLWNVSKKHG